MNPLKECQDIKSFNAFAKQLEAEATSRGHRYTYTDSKNVTHTYSRNQLVYQFNKCRKNSEALVDKKRKVELVVEIHDGLDRIQQLAADQKLTSNWKTKAENKWFSMTHRGFNANKKLSKLQAEFPKTLPVTIYKIKRTWVEQGKLPKYKEIKEALAKESLDIDLLLQDKNRAPILRDDPVMGPAISQYEKRKELEKLKKIDGIVKKIADHMPTIFTDAELCARLGEKGFRLKDASVMQSVLKNEALRQGCLVFLFVDNEWEYVDPGYTNFLIGKASGSLKDLNWFENEVKEDCKALGSRAGVQEFIKERAARIYKAYSEK